MNAPVPEFYDPENGRQLVRFAAVAYEDESPLSIVNYPLSINNPATDTRVVISQPTEQDTILAFRGTRSLQNFVTDITCRRVPLFPESGAQVHEGFLHALDSVWRDITFCLRSAWLKRRLWITGHSLGAALAKLAAARLFRIGQIAGIYTFGEPRVGNVAFRDFYDCWLRDKTFRVVDGEDFITRLPWLLGAFRHSGTEVFYSQLPTQHAPLIAPPWWIKAPSDIFGAWSEWRRDGRIALLADHHVNRYVNLLSDPNPNLTPNPNPQEEIRSGTPLA